jgi:hypothetical protein
LKIAINECGDLSFSSSDETRPSHSKYRHEETKMKWIYWIIFTIVWIFIYVIIELFVADTFQIGFLTGWLGGLSLMYLQKGEL